MHKIIFLGLMAMTIDLPACTGFKLLTKDGQAVHGRTLEFGEKIDLSLAFIPHGQSFTAITPLGEGMTYKTKYAALGAIAFENILLLDAINEKGLSVGTFYFPDFADYAVITNENKSQALSPFDFPNWIVTQFASLDEIKEQLPNVHIAPTIFKNWGTKAAPFHYIVYDKLGNSLVIEPSEGKLKAYDNPIGTLTNSPTFDWHMTNLVNYIHLSPKNVEPVTVRDVEFKPFGQGSGLIGLPGDFSPPARFVRASIFATTAKPSKTIEEAIFQTFHILNQFDIPVGSIQEQVKDGVVVNDYTQATVVRDPINLRYYFKTYDNQNIKLADMKTFDKEGKATLLLNINGHERYQDVSKTFSNNGIKK